MVVDEVAGFFSIPFQKRKTLSDIIFGRGFINDMEVILSKPLAFMNCSGLPALRLARYFRISSEDMLVIHDDIDLPFGRLKIKEKGGNGGHKGIRSLIEAFGRSDFSRLRIGIGRGIVSSGVETEVSDHVLSRFYPEEKKNLSEVINQARDAVVTILCEGIREGMNRFNNKRISIFS
jgi:PTH1 family peptidyl-tRNA hydrolase